MTLLELISKDDSTAKEVKRILAVKSSRLRYRRDNLRNFLRGLGIKNYYTMSEIRQAVYVLQGYKTEVK